MKASHWLLLAAGAVSGVLLLPHLRAVSPPALPRSVPIEHAAGDAQGTGPGGDLLQRLQRESPMAWLQSDPFAARSWSAAPPAVRAAAPTARAAAPAAPVVPAFPYRYAGRVDVGRALKEAYLIRASGELVPVMPGAVIDGVWRIDRLTSEHVEVTYLPLRQNQSLSLASLTGEAARPPSRLAEAEPPAIEESAPRAARNDGVSVASRGVSGDSGGLAVPLGLPAATPVAKLGVEVPTQGSMPTDTGMRGGAAPKGSFPSGPTPSGRLGEATPVGKLGPQ